MVKVIVFNGPPRSGKDTAVSILSRVINNQEGNLFAVHAEFKSPLIKMTSDFLGVTVDEFMINYNEKHINGDWCKDIKMYIVNDNIMSKREALIHVSENVIKPSFGNDAFGKIAANNIGDDGVYLFSDSGFSGELKPIIDKVGAENVMVVRLHKAGCNYNSDSRGYLQPETFNFNVMFNDISNNYSIDQLEYDLLGFCGEFIND